MDLRNFRNACCLDAAVVVSCQVDCGMAGEYLWPLNPSRSALSIPFSANVFVNAQDGCASLRVVSGVRAAIFLVAD